MRITWMVAAAVLCMAPVADASGQARPPAGAGRQQVEAAFDRALRQRVGLSDEQVRRLAPLSQRIEQRRRTLLMEEMTVRQGLRRELGADSADQRIVAESLERLLAIQRQRLDLVAEEQKALSEFMTPVQRARYHALQETVRRGAEDMRRRRMGGPPPRGER
jgi:hypothetical protein